MAAVFTAASSQRLINSATPITATPITVAFWARPVAAGVTGGVWCNADTGSSNHYWAVNQEAGSWNAGARAGAAASFASAGTDTAGVWHFIVARFISATNRRISVIDTKTGLASHGSGTTSRAPLNVDEMAVGATLVALSYADHFNGRVAELWYTNTDIQPDGLQLKDWTLRQLAYGGPFSVPHIAKDIVEYRSLRSALDSRADSPREVYLGAGKTRQTWVNTNGVTLGAHVPLPGSYIRPAETPRLLVI